MYFHFSHIFYNYGGKIFFSTGAKFLENVYLKSQMGFQIWNTLISSPGVPVDSQPRTDL